MICEVCNEENPANSIFCMGCGIGFKQEEDKPENKQIDKMSVKKRLRDLIESRDNTGELVYERDIKERLEEERKKLDKIPDKRLLGGLNNEESNPMHGLAKKFYPHLFDDTPPQMSSYVNLDERKKQIEEIQSLKQAGFSDEYILKKYHSELFIDNFFDRKPCGCSDPEYVHGHTSKEPISCISCDWLNPNHPTNKSCGVCGVIACVDPHIPPIQEQYQQAFINIWWIRRMRYNRWLQDNNDGFPVLTRDMIKHYRDKRRDLYDEIDSAPDIDLISIKADKPPKKSKRRDTVTINHY